VTVRCCAPDAAAAIFLYFSPVLLQRHQRELAPGEGLDVDAGDALKEVVTTALTWSDIAAATGRQGPDVIT